MIACPLLACVAHLSTAIVGPGEYHPDRTHTIEVARFALDVTPVTNADYLAFVRDHGEWRRGAENALYADQGYLAKWAGPLDLGDALPDAPVTGVSWFAARAYCAARGGRLPTIAEWELASEGTPIAQALDWYARPNTEVRVGQTPPDRWGVRDLFGVVWEWADDFNSEFVDGSAGCGAGAADAVDPADYARFMRSAFRSSLEASFTTTNLGFRCAEDL